MSINMRLATVLCLGLALAAGVIASPAYSAQGWILNTKASDDLRGAALVIEIVDRTLHEQGGNVIVPAFAVGRTQEVLCHQHRLTRDGRLRNLKVFVDSPMATEAAHITRRHLELFDDTAKHFAGWHALGQGLPYLHFTASADESRALNQIRSGAIIISASGMAPDWP